MWRRANPHCTNCNVHYPAVELGCSVRCILHPGITGASGGKRRMGDSVAGERRTDNDKHHGQHVDEDTQRGGVVRREDEVGLWFYMQYFQADFCYWKHATSVNGARLTALGARLHTSCLKGIFLILFSALLCQFDFWGSRNYSGYCHARNCQYFALIFSNGWKQWFKFSTLSLRTDMWCSAYLIICINMSSCSFNYAFYWYSPFDRVKSSLGFCFHCPFHGF